MPFGFHGKNIIIELLAKVRNLPFDRLRVNGLRLKLFSFSVRGEPFLRLRSGHSEKTVRPEVLEG
jgi:hypothetical protein